MNQLTAYDTESDSGDELVGPPVPKEFLATGGTSEQSEENEDIGPAVPHEFQASSTNTNDENNASNQVKKKERSDKVPGKSTEGVSYSASSRQEVNSEDDEDLDVGPPVPEELRSSAITEITENIAKLRKDDNYDSDEDSDEDDEDDLAIPVSNTIMLKHGSKAVTAIAVDPAGARLASGSVDYDVRFWDFAGMDSSFQSFRTLTPCGNYPIKHLSYSATGDAVLVISGMSQAKVLDRDGHEIMECVKGDQYVSDMVRTKGHVAQLTCGTWHSRKKEEFVTTSEDGTCRVWDVNNQKQHKGIIKCRAQNGLRTIPTACAFNKEGHTIALACNDGSIQLWDNRKMFVHPAQQLRNAHQKNTETSCIVFSYNSNFLATRGGDDTLKLWDKRNFKKAIFEKDNLFSRYACTDCTFSPNDSLLVTGVSLMKGEKASKLFFFDTTTFNQVKEVEVCESHVIKTIWHPRLQQIFLGCGNGLVGIFYNESKNGRGANLCASKTKKKKKQAEVVVAQQIITPHALPMFRQDKPKSTRKKIEKERLDPVKSKRPDLPIKSGQGGRLAASGSTLSSYVIRNLGLSKRVDDDQDPREAILRYAKDAAENPYWIAPAYTKTQPKPIFLAEEEDASGQPAAKKPKM